MDGWHRHFTDYYDDSFSFTDGGYGSLLASVI